MPALMTLAKGLTSGSCPMGAMFASDRVDGGDRGLRPPAVPSTARYIISGRLIAEPSVKRSVR